MATRTNFEKWKSSVVGVTSEHLSRKSGQVFRELQKGCGKEVWGFIVKHVRTKKQKKTTEGSSILFRNCPRKYKEYFILNKSTSKGHKSEDGQLLPQEKHFLEVDILRLEKDIDELQRALLVADQTSENVQKRHCYVRHKVFLLSENQRLNAVLMDEYLHFMNDINMHLSAALQRRKSSGLSRIFFLAEHSALKETLVFSEVQRILEDDAEQSIDQTAASKESSEPVVPTEQRHDDLQVQVENLLIDFSMRDIFQSLKVHKREAMNEMKHLSGNFENSGNLQFDESSAVHLARISVEQQFEEARNVFIKEFLRLQQKKSELTDCIRKIEVQYQVLDEKLQATYKNCEALQLARSIVKLEMRLCLRNEIIGDLKEVLKWQSRDPKNKTSSLKSTYHEILKSEENISRRHSMIQRVVAVNLETTNSLYREQQRLQEFLRNMLSTYQHKLKTLLHQPTGNVNLEYKLFASLQMENLLTTKVGKYHVKFCDLSLNSLLRHPEMHSVFTAMQVPLFHAPETLLPQACTLLLNTKETSALLEGQDLQTKCFEENTWNNCRRDYLDALQKNEESCRCRILPLLSQHITHANEGILLCGKIKDDIETWWDQPAQKYMHKDETEENKFADWLKNAHRPI